MYPMLYQISVTMAGIFLREISGGSWYVISKDYAVGL
jgi:hypothetical protein